MSPIKIPDSHQDHGCVRIASTSSPPVLVSRFASYVRLLQLQLPKLLDTDLRYATLTAEQRAQLSVRVCRDECTHRKRKDRKTRSTTPFISDQDTSPSSVSSTASFLSSSPSVVTRILLLLLPDRTPTWELCCRSFESLPCVYLPSGT